MSQQNLNNLIVDEAITPDEAWELLFGEGSLLKAVESEERVNCDISAGLDWGKASGFLILNNGLFHRLKTLRISLNQEAKLLISEWNLGVGTRNATITIQERLLDKLSNPSEEMQKHLQAVLLKDDLYGEKFISNREVLQSLLKVLLTESDWQAIASSATDSIHKQVACQANHL
jgi:hypothetical protein